MTAGDTPANVDVSGREILAESFFTFERYDASLLHNGVRTEVLKRDVVRVGRVVGIVCVDPARDEIVLIRQFRLAAQLATGRGEMVEIPAGRLEPGEEIEAAARRECLEETGLEPRRIERLFEIMPAPGVLDEYCTLYLAVVDASHVPDQAGLADEREMTQPFALPIDEAMRLMEDGRCVNGYLVLVLHWLMLNRARIRALA